MLGLRKKEWNNSSSLPKNPSLEEETAERKLIKLKIELGLLKETENKIYEGIETRDLYAGWNVSAQVDIRDLKNNLADLLFMRFI